MALMKCHECGSSHSNKAPACPSCGVPKSKRPVKGAGGLILLIVLGMFVGIPALIGSMAGSGSSQRTSKANRPAVLATTTANIRVGPGTSYEVRRKTMPGERLEIQSTSGDWYQLASAAGSPDLWIHKSVVKPEEKPAQRVQRRAPKPASKVDVQVQQDIWIAKCQDAVRYKLKDGKSAKFRNVEFVRGPGNSPLVRGEVNSKNGFGAYGGFQRFVSGGSADLTFLEEEVSDFQVLWNELGR